MSLQEWVRRNGKGAKSRLATAIGCRWATIHDLVTGRRMPRPETALAIEKATAGAVTASELLGFRRGQSDLEVHS